MESRCGIAKVVRRLSGHLLSTWGYYIQIQEGRSDRYTSLAYLINFVSYVRQGNPRRGDILHLERLGPPKTASAASRPGMRQSTQAQERYTRRGTFSEQFSDSDDEDDRGNNDWDKLLA